MLDLSLGSWRIWYGKVFELLFIMLLEILEFWRIYLWKLKILHDKFMYDESLIPTTAIYTCLLDYERLSLVSLAAYKHWVWSVCVDPRGLVMQLKSKFTCTPSTYAASTLEVCI
jgi:hypothetical protein